MDFIQSNITFDRPPLGGLDDDKAILKLVYCRRLAHAIRWAKYGTGPERQLTRERYCQVCLESGLRRLALGLGFEFEVEFTPEGCIQILAHKNENVDDKKADKGSGE